MKNKLILYIAMSLDGYIADQNGGIGFLEETPTTLPDLGYEEFYSSIRSIIFGGKTYRQVKNELSPEQWPYEGMPCYIYSRKQQKAEPGISFTDLPPAQLLQEIRKEHPGNTWLMGGGEIIRSFMMENLIDEYYIYVMPVILGDGIPLFPPGFPKASLRLTSCKNIGEIAELIYYRSERR